MQKNAQDKKAMLVLDAASRVFFEHGFSAATTDMIQKEAGVSKATVYSRYANKEALFSAVIKDACGRFTGLVQQIQVTPGDINKVLTEIGHTYLSILLTAEALSLHRVVLAEAVKFPQLARSFYLSGPATMTKIVAGHLQQAAEAGEIDIQLLGRDSAAAVFMGILRGEAHMMALTHPEAQASEAQIDQWVENAVTTFLRAYGRQEK